MLQWELVSVLLSIKAADKSQMLLGNYGDGNVALFFFQLLLFISIIFSENF